MTHARVATVVLGTAVAAVVAVFSLARGQQFHRNSFEAREPVWVRGGADAPFRELLHTMTDQTAHSGQLSEYLKFETEKGTYIHYLYATARAPLGDELGASIWLKSNRPGLQLLGRLVLPKERNPGNLEEHMTTLLRGDVYQNVGRWQKLSLARPVKLAQQQQQLLQADLKRPVDFTDAYLDNLAVNVYSGPGLTELWIDDLEIGPVVENTSPFQPTSRPIRPEDGKANLPSPRPINRPSVVELNQDQLLVGGKRFFIRGIRYTDTPLKTLRDAHFNTVWLDRNTSPGTIEEALNLGLWMVPCFPAADENRGLATADGLRGELDRFPGDAVLFRDLGGGLVYDQAALVTLTARAIHEVDANHPVGADVWDGFRTYGRSLDLIGVHRWPLMTGLELGRYREWLTERRLLARPGAFMYTWIQTHLPDWYTNLVYDRPPSAGFQESIGPQPEQIRLLTYCAIASGCRGIAYWSDRFLADSHQGRDRLLALALLNQELEMLEPLLVTADTPSWISATNSEAKDIKAAVMRTQHGVLVLPMWLGYGAQYVPGQAAAAKVTLTVPEVPNGAQAWLVSPTDVRSLKSERIAGGSRITIPDFGLTAAVVFTSDNSPTGILVRFQEQSRRLRKLAAQWTHDLAEIELDKVAKVETELEELGHTQPDAKQLLENSRLRLRDCVSHWNNGDFRQAAEEAERSMRPLRILMRAQWEVAARGLDAPMSSPYALSFYTLPQHWRFIDQVKQSIVAPANLLPDGGFETPDSAVSAWTKHANTLDDVTMVAERASRDPKEGKQCYMLQVKPKDTVAPPPLALERTFLTIDSPLVRVQPGSLVAISGWVKIPKTITASPDGALLYDSVGGEPLAVRLTYATGWRKFTFYRKAPPSGVVQMTMGMMGLGTVYFDDLRIEPITGGAAPSAN